MITPELYDELRWKPGVNGVPYMGYERDTLLVGGCPRRGGGG
jgi:hypothetical protein